MTQNGTASTVEPVTFIVSRRVKLGCEAAFEDWVRGVSQAALQFEGHMGVNVIRPGAGSPYYNEYVVIFRFDNYANLRRWVQSDVRQDWLDRVQPFIVGEPQIHIETGLEYWFTPPARPTASRHKQAFLTWAAIFPLSALINAVFHPLLEALPFLLRTMLVSAALVSMLTYIIMPRLTRALQKWLFSSAHVQGIK